MQNIYMSAMKYGYSNSRVKAMEAKLISRPTMQSILNATDISSALAILFQTDYRKDITDYGGVDMKAELVDFALSKNLAEHLGRLYTISPWDDRPIVRAMIGKWDLYNVKLALEARDRKMGFDSIARYVIDSGQYKGSVIRDIMRESTIEGMLNRFMLNSPYRNILAVAYDTYTKNKSVTEAIAAIDKAYYEGLSRTIKRLSGEDTNSAIIIRMEIDMVNVLTMIRAKKLGLKFQEIERDIIANGRIAGDELNRIFNSSTGIEGIVQQVKTFDLSETLQAYNRNKQLLTFEIGMRNSIFDSSMRLLRHAVLSFGTIMAYMYLKEIEVYTLRISINSRYYGLSKDDVSRLITWK